MAWRWGFRDSKRDRESLRFKEILGLPLRLIWQDPIWHGVRYTSFARERLGRSDLWEHVRSGTQRLQAVLSTICIGDCLVTRMRACPNMRKALSSLLRYKIYQQELSKQCTATMSLQYVLHPPSMLLRAIRSTTTFVRSLAFSSQPPPFPTLANRLLQPATQ